MNNIPQVVILLVQHCHDYATAEAHNCSPRDCADQIIEHSFTTLEQLQEIICGHTFADDASEILFFKKMKAEIVSNYLFYGLVRGFHLNMPMGGDESIQNYIRNQFSEIGKFFDANKPMIMDIREGRTHQDAHLFLRRNYSWLTSFHTHDAFNHRGFTTNGDQTYALYMAYTRFREYLRSLSIPEMTVGHPAFYGSFGQKPWPLTKADVVELGVSMYAAGKAPAGFTKQQTIELLSHFFQVHVTDVHGIMRDIGERVEGPATLLQCLTKKLIEFFKHWNLQREKKYYDKRFKE